MTGAPIANKGTDANPDRVLIAGNAEFWIDTSEATGALISRLVWANVVGGEFDRDRTTKAFTVQSIGRLMFRTFGPENQLHRFGFVPWFDAGFETGKNVLNKISDHGSGKTGRAYLGVTAYQRLFVPWIALTVVHQARKPLREEVFYRKRLPESETELRMTKETRSYSEAALVINLKGFASLKPTFKRGALPPAFSYIDNEWSLAIQFGAKALTKKP